MRPDEREALRSCFQRRCGYCGVREQDAGAELTVDHFRPRSRGGLDDPENWVYCCHACNEFKGVFWQPTSPHRILHPLKDDLAAHLIEQEDGTLHPHSETGAFHIERLHLNRPQLVAYRQEQRSLEAARQSQTRLLERLEHLEKQVRSLTAKLQQFDGGDPSV